MPPALMKMAISLSLFMQLSSNGYLAPNPTLTLTFMHSATEFYGVVGYTVKASVGSGTFAPSLFLSLSSILFLDSSCLITFIQLPVHFDTGCRWPHSRLPRHQLYIKVCHSFGTWWWSSTKSGQVRVSKWTYSLVHLDIRQDSIAGYHEATNSYGELIPNPE